MTIIGIDQSFTNTGICIKNSDEYTFKVHSTVPDKEDLLEKFKRAKQIALRILEDIRDFDVTDVRLEGLAMGNIKGNSSRDLSILQGVIVTHILDHYPDMPIKIITPTSVKKYATGKGNSPKDELFNCLPENIKEILMGYPKTKGRLDLCDAYWIANFEDNK